ncbi:MAG: acylphosphatase, partial [Ignavibacterium sp.]|nr:acylphosphatase [Ignavibacterium sp.]
LNGIIANNVNGVRIDVDGDECILNEFISRIKSEKTAH